MNRPSRSDDVVVGHFNARHEIVVYREPDTGIKWEAEAKGMSLAALGDTPDDAVRNLMRAINERGIPGSDQTDLRIAEKWEPVDD